MLRHPRLIRRETRLLMPQRRCKVFSPRETLRRRNVRFIVKLNSSRTLIRCINTLIRCTNFAVGSKSSLMSNYECSTEKSHTLGFSELRSMVNVCRDGLLRNCPSFSMQSRRSDRRDSAQKRNDENHFPDKPFLGWAQTSYCKVCASL